MGEKDNEMKMNTKSKKNGMQYSLQRYIWIGAGLGLYFGLFFRPSREPSLLIALGLSLVITIVMFLIRLFQRDRLPFQEILKEVPINFLQYLLILAVLEGRHLAWEMGGRTATTILTTLMGMVTGALVFWKSNGKVTGIGR